MQPIVLSFFFFLQGPHSPWRGWWKFQILWLEKYINISFWEVQRLLGSTESECEMLHCTVNYEMKGWFSPGGSPPTALVSSEAWGFFPSGHRIPVDQGTPASRIQCLMIWGGVDVIITEIKCTINIMHFDPPQTIPPHPCPRPWKNCIPGCQKGWGPLLKCRQRSKAVSYLGKHTARAACKNNQRWGFRHVVESKE